MDRTALTEAVPLSLSSMAHASLDLNDGVLDGIKQVIAHMLLACRNYARTVHPPHQWTFHDLSTSEFAWSPVREEAGTTHDLPLSLQRMSFNHKYSRNAWIYLTPCLPHGLSANEERERMQDWTHQLGVLGRISLLYVSEEPLTPGEMDGSDTNEMPACILYKAIVEYSSLPATGKKGAVQAEELSMISFGGSIDDDVKYGALASLYDEHAKYALEIYSVRGKKYKFDLMDSLLSDGSAPQLPSGSVGDPLVKSLCLTVTDHSLATENVLNQSYAITRMSLTLEGKLKKGGNFKGLPKFDEISNGIQDSFLQLRAIRPTIASAQPSGHRLLLDREDAGRIYVDGRYVTTWGKDCSIGSHGVALFGIDLHSIRLRHGRIVNYEEMKKAYAILLHELLIDARLAELDIAGRLLSRLMRGVDEDYLYDDEDEADTGTHLDCLESQILASLDYDTVGIAPKALGIRFRKEFGVAAFPCEAHEVEWVKSILPDRIPVAVPSRLERILRRGGYFNTQKTSDVVWFASWRPATMGREIHIVDRAIKLLQRAGCDDVEPEQIVFVEDIDVDPVKKKAVCRFNDLLRQYRVNARFMEAAVEEYTAGHDGSDHDQVRAFLLGMYVAQEHPDGGVLARFVIRNR